jgi:Flp pilus assembly protein TadD
MALLKKGQMEEAESEIKEAVSSQPDNAAARNSYGVILAHQKRITAAREQFEKALILDPGNMNYAGNLQKIIKGDSSVQK